MKKNLIIIGIAALAFVACNKEPGENYPTPNPGTAYVLEGTVSTAGFTWDNTSIVGLYGLTQGVNVRNVECKIDGWVVPSDTSAWTPSPYAGQATAKFTTPAINLVAGKNDFLIYTPYDEEMSYVPSLGLIYDLSIAEKQTQPQPNVAGGCFALGKCTAIPGVDETFKFTLNPLSALLKINVSTSEFVGYGLKKVTVSDATGVAKLGGTFDVDVNTLAFTPNNTFSKVSTTISAPKAIKAGETQSIYLNLLPSDLSSTELTIIVELTGDKGNVIIPFKRNGVNLEAGKTSEITFEDLKSSDCSLKWYCPVESRALPALGYAYGDANTYVIQCKTATFKGATLTPNSDIPSEVVIDYRARGNFDKVTDPTGATFEWYMAETMGKPYIYAPIDNKCDQHGVERNTTYNYIVTDGKISFVVDEANYRVTVKNESLLAGTPILVMKKDGKILWAWTFWNIAADGTKLEGIKVGESTMASMCIGQVTTDMSIWATGDNPGWATIHLYQWGRYMPIFRTTGYFNLIDDELHNGSIPSLWGPASFQDALDHPVAFITPQERGVNSENWSTEYYGDLWGGNVNGDEDAVGTKSIYDPCPKGWRVPDPKMMKDIVALNPSLNTTNGSQGIIVNGSLILAAGYVNGKTDEKKTTEYRLATQGGAYTSANYAICWTNFAGAHTIKSPMGLNFGNQVNPSCKTAKFTRTVAAPVRCQKDENNR